MRHFCVILLFVFAATANAQVPAASEADFVVKDFHFQSGEVLPEVRIHYATIGKLHGTNAVLVLHGPADRCNSF